MAFQEAPAPDLDCAVQAELKHVAAVRFLGPRTEACCCRAIPGPLQSRVSCTPCAFSGAQLWGLSWRHLAPSTMRWAPLPHCTLTSIMLGALAGDECRVQVLQLPPWTPARAYSVEGRAGSPVRSSSLPEVPPAPSCHVLLLPPGAHLGGDQ